MARTPRASRRARTPEIVRRARAAGAIVIGKTLMPGARSSSRGRSRRRWGVTHNPWKLERSPGGSSGGSAAAVAAGLVGAALAGDGGGSIRFPSAYCGLFGLKTQRGRVPLAPRGEVWQGLVVAGVLTRSVRDSALFHDAIADGPPDPGAPAVPPSSFLGAYTAAGGDRPTGSARRAAYSAGERPSRLADSQSSTREPGGARGDGCAAARAGPRGARV